MTDLYSFENCRGVIGISAGQKISSILCQSYQMGQNGLLEKHVIVILVRMMLKLPQISPAPLPYELFKWMMLF